MNNMKKLISITLICLSLSAISCTDAKMSKITALGSKHKVELIGYDGTVIREWISSGKPLSEANSDGYYFKDTKTGKIIEVSGTLIITTL